MFILPSIKHVLLLLQGPRRPQIKTILKIYLHCYIAHFFVDCPKQIFINLLLSIIVDFKLLSCASCFFILVCKNETYSYYSYNIILNIYVLLLTVKQMISCFVLTSLRDCVVILVINLDLKNEWSWSLVLCVLCNWKIWMWFCLIIEFLK